MQLVARCAESRIKQTTLSVTLCGLFSCKRLYRRTGTFGLGGAVTLLPEKITRCPKASVVQTHSNRSKNKKTFTIPTSNERIITPELQLNPDFSNLREKRKSVRKIGYFEKSGVTKITRKGKRLLFRVIGRFEKIKVREIGIQLQLFLNLAYSMTSIDCLIK